MSMMIMATERRRSMIAPAPTERHAIAYDDELRQFVKTQTQISNPNLRTRYKYNYGRAFGEVRETIDP